MVAEGLSPPRHQDKPVLATAGCAQGPVTAADLIAPGRLLGAPRDQRQPPVPAGTSRLRGAARGRAGAGTAGGPGRAGAARLPCARPDPRGQRQGTRARVVVRGVGPGQARAGPAQAPAAARGLRSPAVPESGRGRPLCPPCAGGAAAPSGPTPLCEELGQPPAAAGSPTAGGCPDRPAPRASGIPRAAAQRGVPAGRGRGSRCWSRPPRVRFSRSAVAPGLFLQGSAGIGGVFCPGCGGLAAGPRREPSDRGSAGSGARSNRASCRSEPSWCLVGKAAPAASPAAGGTVWHLYNFAYYLYRSLTYGCVCDELNLASFLRVLGNSGS